MIWERHSGCGISLNLIVWNAWGKLLTLCWLAVQVMPVKVVCAEEATSRQIIKDSCCYTISVSAPHIHPPCFTKELPQACIVSAQRWKHIELVCAHSPLSCSKNKLFLWHCSIHAAVLIILTQFMSCILNLKLSLGAVWFVQVKLFITAKVKCHQEHLLCVNDIICLLACMSHAVSVLVWSHCFMLAHAPLCSISLWGDRV